MKIVVVALISLALVSGIYLKHEWIMGTISQTVEGPKTTAERLDQYGALVAARLKPDFDKAGVVYPPGKVTLVVLKEERRLELYAENADPALNPAPPGWRFIRSYPILAASGHMGPKLFEGDGQVPEGIYAVESLNPNSKYHLALRVDYPNALDREYAAADGRTQLGGDIMIHGSDVSIGCVAMGDPAAEDLFILTARTGLPNVRLIFCPFDFRRPAQAPLMPALPLRLTKFYNDLAKNLEALPLPPAPNPS